MRRSSRHHRRATILKPSFIVIQITHQNTIPTENICADRGFIHIHEYSFPCCGMKIPNNTRHFVERISNADQYVMCSSMTIPGVRSEEREERYMTFKRTST